MLTFPPTTVEAEKKEQCGFEKNNGAEQGEVGRWVHSLEREVSCIEELELCASVEWKKEEKKKMTCTQFVCFTAEMQEANTQNVEMYPDQMRQL